MSHFGMSSTDMESRGAQWTAREIAQQPEIWGVVQSLVEKHRDRMSQFLAPLLAQKDLRIILTGAGTSAFIGQCLTPSLLHKLQRRVEAIATTDLVSGPELTLQEGVPTLLVSFARSGSSPESIAAIDLADEVVERCYHLVFTCNREGALYQRMHMRANAQVLLLPEETNDRAFAMSSSFSSMLLAAAQVFELIGPSMPDVGAVSSAASEFMAGSGPMFSELVALPIERVVYLGSNGLKGLAQEAALKLLELTDGKLVASSDSPLGFRHGPKTIINSSTLVVFFLSNDTYTRQYDLDLLRELRSEGRAACVLALSAQTSDLPEHGDNIVFALPQAVQDLALMLLFIVFAQLFALLQSLRMHITPDNPSASGTVTRVVSGVTIHSLHREALDVLGR
jgi:tagatose-6-phosphate ketose/aldose isomerase